MAKAKAKTRTIGGNRFLEVRGINKKGDKNFQQIIYFYEHFMFKRTAIFIS